MKRSVIRDFLNTLEWNMIFGGGDERTLEDRHDELVEELRAKWQIRRCGVRRSRSRRAS